MTSTSIVLWNTGTTSPLALAAVSPQHSVGRFAPQDPHRRMIGRVTMSAMRGNNSPSCQSTPRTKQREQASKGTTSYGWSPAHGIPTNECNLRNRPQELKSLEQDGRPRFKEPGLPSAQLKGAPYEKAEKAAIHSVVVQLSSPLFRARNSSPAAGHPGPRSTSPRKCRSSFAKRNRERPVSRGTLVPLGSRDRPGRLPIRAFPSAWDDP